MRDAGPSSWPEARGPHLPDRVTSTSPLVGPFVALAAWAAISSWGFWQTATGYTATAVVSIGLHDLGAIATALLGAAFFVRHPDGVRRHPGIALGVSLLAVTVVLDLLAEPLSDAYATLTPADDTSFVPAAFVATVIEHAVAIVALVAVARGLVDGREQPEDGSTRGLAMVLTLVVVTSQLLVFGGSLRFGAELIWPSGLQAVEGLAATTASLLAWAYLSLVAARGWVAVERPAAAWLLAALSGAAAVVAAAILAAATWVAVPGQDGIAAGVVPAIWLGELDSILLLGAFALGLPGLGRSQRPALAPDA